MPSSASCRDAHAVMPRPRGIQDRTAIDAVVLVDLRATDNLRDCQSVEEILAKNRDELSPEAAAALRRFNGAIERQGPACCLDEGHVIDVGPDGVNPLELKFYFLRSQSKG
jgi:hypothetical protein